MRRRTAEAVAASEIMPLDLVAWALFRHGHSAEDVAAAVGEAATIAGATYIATAISAPGVITQTGSHRRIVFGECFGASAAVSHRVRAIEAEMKAADIHAEAVIDARPAIWEKFTYLAPFAAFTGAARLPIGPLWADEQCRSMFLEAVGEVSAVTPGDVLPWCASFVGCRAFQ